MYRAFDPILPNTICNHPSVRPWLGGEGPIDLSSLLADEANIWLMDDSDLGGFFWHRQGLGVYELHSQFLPEGRGRLALRACHEALEWMFTGTEMLELWTKVPTSNLAALGLTRLMGAQLWFERPGAWTHGDGTSESVRYYRGLYPDWAQKSLRCRQEGEAMHKAFEAQGWSHPPDRAHNAAVGAASLTFKAGQPAKAVAMYNHWARFAGYGEAQILALEPPVVLIDGLKLTITEHGLEVL